MFFPLYCLHSWNIRAVEFILSRMNSYLINRCQYVVGVEETDTSRERLIGLIPLGKQFYLLVG